MLSAADPTLYPLASRGARAIEGPSIVRRGGFYYLFASFDFCCRGVNSDYRVVVGRSASVTGPYVDRGGVADARGGGTELLRGYNEFARHRPRRRLPPTAAPTGSPTTTTTGTTAHPRLSVRPIAWSRGWPQPRRPAVRQPAAGPRPGLSTVVNRDSGAVLDNPACGYEGADIRLARRSRSPCQRWRLEDRGDG